MIRIMLKSKVYYATVTDAQLYYQGSITIDQDIMDAADLAPSERVDVLNVNNGKRLQTYVISGKRGSGEICLNGPAARCGYKGDKIVVVTYAMFTQEEIKKHKPRLVELDHGNKVKNTNMA